MSIDFDSLMAYQTIADLRASVVSACESVSFYVTRLPPLSRLRKLALDVVPVIVNTWSTVNTDAIRGGLLDYAEGAWLTLLARNLFGVERIAETFATVDVTFTNAGLNQYNFSDKEVIVGTGAVTYEAPAFALAPFGQDGATATVTVTCKTAGSAGSTEAATITTMVTTFDGVTCTNAAAAVGTDEETDDALRARCRLSRSALSNSGPVGAIEFVALSATYEDGTAVGVTRVQVVEDNPSMGDVHVYLADADGAVSDDAVDRVDHLLRTLVIPTGVNYVDTDAASTTTVPVTYTARYKASAGFSTDELAEMVAEALATFFAEHPIGGYIESGGGPNGTMYRSELATTIGSVSDEESGTKPIKGVTVSAPSGDVTLTPGQVAVLGAITPNWVAV